MREAYRLNFRSYAEPQSSPRGGAWRNPGRNRFQKRPHRQCSQRRNSRRNVAVDDGRVIGIGDYKGRKTIDLRGAYLARVDRRTFSHRKLDVDRCRNSCGQWFRMARARW